MSELHVYLPNLEHNYRVIRSRLHSKTDLIAVVKAGAYGNAAIPIARRLEELGVDALAVAYSEEGILLRKSGIKKPILVFYPQLEGLDTLITHQLEPCLYSTTLLEKFGSLAKKNNEKNYPVHIKYNTGLNRIGFAPSQVSWVLNQLNEPFLDLKSVYSHLAASEASKDDSLSKLQLKTFLDLRKHHLELTPKSPKFHLLNSSGVFNYPEYQFDAVRVGIALHGYANQPHWDHELKVVSELKTKICQIHTVKKGAYVGYDHGWKTTRESLIAVLPVGHADGIGRHFGHHKGRVFVRGKWAPIVGNICMDLLMIDVTETPCKEGDEVSFFGTSHPASDFAERGNTISYELLTGLGPRIKRIVHKTI